MYIFPCKYTCFHVSGACVTDVCLVRVSSMCACVYVRHVVCVKLEAGPIPLGVNGWRAQILVPHVGHGGYWPLGPVCYVNTSCFCS